MMDDPRSLSGPPCFYQLLHGAQMGPLNRVGAVFPEGWLAERFRRHAGNADVVRQEFAAEKGIAVSLRTVERSKASCEL